MYGVPPALISWRDLSNVMVNSYSNFGKLRAKLPDTNNTQVTWFFRVNDAFASEVVPVPCSSNFTVKEAEPSLRS